MLNRQFSAPLDGNIEKLVIHVIYIDCLHSRLKVLVGVQLLMYHESYVHVVEAGSMEEWLILGMFSMF